MRLLADIYERCKYAQVLKPHDFDEVVKSRDWYKAMDEEIAILKRNQI